MFLHPWLFPILLVIVLITMLIRLPKLSARQPHWSKPAVYASQGLMMLYGAGVIFTNAPTKGQMIFGLGILSVGLTAFAMAVPEAKRYIKFKKENHANLA